ncbi:hypothetical protein [Amycolatopsis minnesotensis]|uniref:ABC transporter n=1 Tax=Amycolatopsis minnesotensis TaxID=337894 RepID=A0ABN2QZM9_9PSEU
MTALVRYVLLDSLQSQRYFPPVALYLVAAMVLTSSGEDAVAPLFALTAAALLVCSTWLTVAVHNSEDPVQRAITAVNAGSPRRVLLAGIVVALGSSAVLGLFGLAYPLLVVGHAAPLTLLAGLEAELLSAFVGVAIGTVCCRLVVPRIGYAVICAVVGLVIAGLSPWLPLVHPAFQLLVRDAPPAELAGSMLPLLACGALVLVGCGAVTEAVARRRG